MVYKYYQTEEFLPQLNSMQKHIRKTVIESLNDFALKNENNVPVMDFKKLSSDYNLYRLKANKDVRIIIHKDKKTKSYVFLWVDKHDLAYEWARKCNYVFDEDYLSEFKLKSLSANMKAKENQKKIQNICIPHFDIPKIFSGEKKYLFEQISSDLLIDIGIPEELIDHVKSIKTYLGFGKLKNVIPSPSYLLLKYYLIENRK